VSATFEHIIQLDLEHTIRRVSSTIQADCRIVKFSINEHDFSFSAAVGENHGQPEWHYTLNGTPIHITAIECDFRAELSLYNETQQTQKFWARTAQQMAEMFFRLNPVYHHAISW
jgi:hypothetical protein